ncbi:hypothetical protein [Zobellia barbeyronii]|uniref:POTRA domain-containing protein n=1 Tax=Zobellia barbeyronii TaxID=2748009 RepID=A0ABS5WN92_9FLAO|nr:hypothetical protein [Zobellia barbeyronii]MBT2163597.1 hypothetical protein [Zobellia barbeyronii]
MKNIFIIIVILPLFALSQEKETNNLVGENIPLRIAFQEIKMSESDITPRNGFITIRRLLSKNGQFSEIKSFQIDEDYNNIEFNNGELLKKLESITLGLKGWKRDRDYENFSLIRIKIKDGKIEEIF